MQKNWIDPEYVVFVEGYYFRPRRLGELIFSSSVYSNVFLFCNLFR